MPPLTQTRRPQATSESNRARRFALPDHGSDERGDQAIEAFLDGPPVRRQRPTRRRPRKSYPNNGNAKAPANAVIPAPEPDPRRAVAGAIRPVPDIRTIPGRLEFGAALERESQRAARYGRPASVAIVELVPERVSQQVDIWLRSLAGPVSRTLRQSARATDLVARVANARFQVLLPETPEAGAGRFAERVSTACQGSIDDAGAPVAVRVTVAVATPDHSLEEALAHALQSIEAA
jgi:Diguanylate cyclase, GGDEF domain